MVGKIKKKKKVGGQQSVSNVSIQPGEQVSKVSILIVHRLSCFFCILLEASGCCFLLLAHCPILTLCSSMCYRYFQ